MTSFVSSLCRTLTSCWNASTEKGKAEIKTGAPDGPCRPAPIAPRQARVPQPLGDLGEDPTDVDLDDSMEQPHDDENRRIVIPYQTPALGGAVQMLKQDGECPEKHLASNDLSRKSSADVSDSVSESVSTIAPLVRAPHGTNEVETIKQGVEKKAEEMYQILREAAECWHNRINKTETAREMWGLNMQLIAKLPDTLRQKHAPCLDCNFESIPQYLVYHNRQIGQDELRGALVYWIKTFGDHVHVFPHVLPFHYDVPDFQFLADARRTFHNFVETASRERKPTLALIDMWGHCMGLVADFSDGTPAYYICDVVTSATQVNWDALAEDYINRIRFLSCGEIKETNTTYLGNRLHGHISNANGPLMCWMLEQLAAELKAKPGPIDDAIHRCYTSWLLNVAGEGAQSDFDCRLRAKILACT
ncbi:hypothetical protein [Noviherbaspirillum sp.]|uniref:hypothetical protein n=1 Tax=Noviherbaspirillum sp. TaxID=1926288 RepID=UPI002D42A0E9|nr:hypothetical protein [Noviherbaspirillum sp.]HZW19829.1 hypothetical protein [Noviherbaspirillum sp.]